MAVKQETVRQPAPTPSLDRVRIEGPDYSLAKGIEAGVGIYKQARAESKLNDFADAYGQAEAETLAALKNSEAQANSVVEAALAAPVAGEALSPEAVAAKRELAKLDALERQYPEQSAFINTRRQMETSKFITNNPDLAREGVAMTERGRFGSVGREIAYQEALQKVNLERQQSRVDDYIAQSTALGINQGLRDTDRNEYVRQTSRAMNAAQNIANTGRDIAMMEQQAAVIMPEINKRIPDMVVYFATSIEETSRVIQETVDAGVATGDLDTPEKIARLTRELKKNGLDTAYKIKREIDPNNVVSDSDYMAALAVPLSMIDDFIATQGIVAEQGKVDAMIAVTGAKGVMNNNPTLVQAAHTLKLIAPALTTPGGANKGVVLVDDMIKALAGNQLRNSSVNEGLNTNPDIGTQAAQMGYSEEEQAEIAQRELTGVAKLQYNPQPTNYNEDPEEIKVDAITRVANTVSQIFGTGADKVKSGDMTLLATGTRDAALTLLASESVRDSWPLLSSQLKKQAQPTIFEYIDIEMAYIGNKIIPDIAQTLDLTVKTINGPGLGGPTLGFNITKGLEILGLDDAVIRGFDKDKGEVNYPLRDYVELTVEKNTGKIFFQRRAEDPLKPLLPHQQRKADRLAAQLNTEATPTMTRALRAAAHTDPLFDASNPDYSSTWYSFATQAFINNNFEVVLR